MAVAYNKFDQAAADFMHGVHRFSTSSSLKFMLTNSAPTSTLATSTEIIQISSGNGYSGGVLGGIDIVISSVALSSSYIVQANSVTLTATANSIGPFRYSVLYNAGSTVITTGPLLGWYDYGVPITLNNADIFTISS